MAHSLIFAEYVIHDFSFVEVLRGRAETKKRAQKVAKTSQLELWENLH